MKAKHLLPFVAVTLFAGAAHGQDLPSSGEVQFAYQQLNVVESSVNQIEAQAANAPGEGRKEDILAAVLEMKHAVQASKSYLQQWQVSGPSLSLLIEVCTHVQNIDTGYFTVDFANGFGGPAIVSQAVITSGNGANKLALQTLKCNLI